MRVPETQIWKENGVEMAITDIDSAATVSGIVAEHEAFHAVALGLNEFDSATIIPDNDALGKTRAKRRVTPIAAAAPAAFGYPGIRHDMQMVQSLGVNPESAKAAARTALSGQWPEIIAVAQMLQEKKRIGPDDMRAALERAGRIRQRVFQARIAVRYPDGRQRVFIAELPKSFMKKPSLADLPLVV